MDCRLVSRSLRRKTPLECSPAMVKLSNKSLMYFEDLTLPNVQVVVMTASMGCARCRQRVSQVTSKMKGLREYTVDMLNKQVTVKGDFHYKLKEEDGYFDCEMNNGGCFHPLKLFFRSFLRTCLKQHNSLL